MALWKTAKLLRPLSSSSSSLRALTVEPSLRGMRLQDYLYQQFPNIQRTVLRGLLDRGLVRVNGMAEVRNVRLAPMDYVELPNSEITGARQRGKVTVTKPEQLQVLHESETVLVLAKPAGLPTVPDRSGSSASIHGLLAGLRPEADLRIAHRLDRDTSGCLVLAKGVQAARHLDSCFGGGLVTKRYRALVSGCVRRQSQVVDRFLGPDPKRPGKVVASTQHKRGFREAVTEVTVDEAFAGHTLLQLQPRTGRGHQLRVHLQCLGHPIVGDRDYGGETLLLSRLKNGYKLRPGVVERPLLGRMFLHAQAIAFDDVCGTPVAVEAVLPSDLQLALDKLRRFCSRN